MWWMRYQEVCNGRSNLLNLWSASRWPSVCSSCLISIRLNSHQLRQLKLRHFVIQTKFVLIGQIKTIWIETIWIKTIWFKTIWFKTIWFKTIWFKTNCIKTIWNKTTWTQTVPFLIEIFRTRSWIFSSKKTIFVEQGGSFLRSRMQSFVFWLWMDFNTHFGKWVGQVDHAIDEISRSLQWPVTVAEPLVSKPPTIDLFFWVNMTATTTKTTRMTLGQKNLTCTMCWVVVCVFPSSQK